ELGPHALAAGGPAAVDTLRALGAPDDVAGEAAHRIAVGLSHAAGALALLAAALGLASASRRWAFPALAAVAVAVTGLAASPLALYAGTAVPRDDSLLGPVRAADPLARISVPFPLLRGPADLDHWARVHWMESRLGMPSHGVEARVGNIEAYSGVLPTRILLVSGAFAEHFGPARLQAFRRLGLSHVVIGEPGTEEQAALGRAALEGARLMQRDPTWGASVWSVPHRDWASFATGAVAAATPIDAARTLVELVASSRSDVVVEGSPRSTLSTGQVLSASRTDGEVCIVARSEGAGLLVVNEAFAPGWKADVDGVPVEVLATDVAVRAVPWPSGRHELRMWYEMPGWSPGVWLTGLGAIALAVIAGAAARRRRATSPAS
ncbi:MAG TPA: hypothetical protein PLL32_11275, partial [Anaeromyxobacteraceae bacterium]|nr:hypothetical protein [Anaeromyxobacteraceae bacterium]